MGKPNPARRRADKFNAMRRNVRQRHVPPRFAERQEQADIERSRPGPVDAPRRPGPVDAGQDETEG